MPLRMRVHDREPSGSDQRGFKKNPERNGLEKKVAKSKTHRKPCRRRRRAKPRQPAGIRKAKMRTTTPV